MADGNRSAKGKEVVVDDDPAASYWTVGGGAPSAAEPVANPYDAGYFSYGAAGGSWTGGSGSYGVPGGAAGAVGWDGASGSNFGSDGAANNANYGGSRAVDRRGGGYGMGFLPENGGAFFPPAHGIDPRVYAQATQLQAAPAGYWPNMNGGGGGPGAQSAGPGYWPAGNGGGGSAPAPFPSPFTGNGIPRLEHARTGNSSRHAAGGYRGGNATFPSPHPHMGDGMYAVPYHAPPHGDGQQRSRSPLSRYREQLNTLIESSLRSLSFGDRGESLLARGRRHLSDLVGSHGRQQEPPPQQQQLNAGGGDMPQSATSPPAPPTRTRGGGWRT
ncbi:unnamed protein product [Urochloa decumbens]|uniref:Uncharacterized protein n=1 Tax=Urochloa decumbens TaxID=240449 RepID=A0ABC9EHS5_9POAL